MEVRKKEKRFPFITSLERIFKLRLYELRKLIYVHTFICLWMKLCLRDIRGQVRMSEHNGHLDSTFYHRTSILIILIPTNVYFMEFSSLERMALKFSIFLAHTLFNAAIYLVAPVAF